VPARNDTLNLALIAVVVAAADQVSKAALVAAIGPAQPASRIDLLGRWFSLEYAENRGAAFGAFAGLAPLLAVASIALLAGILIHYLRTSQPPIWQTLATGAIVGGALGNMMDRVRLGYVIDFVSIGPWPNFNVADSAISVGVLTLLWGWFRSGSARDATGAGF
jgi:signal peptidase II